MDTPETISGLPRLFTDGPSATSKGETHNLLLDMTPILSTRRGRGLELVVEKLEQGVPHLDNSGRHGRDVLLPGFKEFVLGQDHRDLVDIKPRRITTIERVSDRPTLTRRWRRSETHDVSTVSGRITDLASLQDGQLGLDTIGLLGRGSHHVERTNTFIVQSSVLSE